ncbi:MAG: hypothetical protein HW416_2266 [Chloroflexi bacterium]|nr:hypothetical protein [Chloroflexota bacterium]
MCSAMCSSHSVSVYASPHMVNVQRNVQFSRWMAAQIAVAEIRFIDTTVTNRYYCDGFGAISS